MSLSEFRAFSEDLKKVLDISEVELSYFKRKSKECKGYRIFDYQVNFNGAGKDGQDTFYLPREIVEEVNRNQLNMVDGRYFCSCKTSKKPYDKCVTAALILARIHFGRDFKIASDGQIHDWKDGIELVEKAIGGEVTVEMDKLDKENPIMVYYSRAVGKVIEEPKEVIPVASDYLEDIMG